MSESDTSSAPLPSLATATPRGESRLAIALGPSENPPLRGPPPARVRRVQEPAGVAGALSERRA